MPNNPLEALAIEQVDEKSNINKALLLRYAELKLQISKYESELEMLKEQVKEEVEAIVGDTDQHLELTELPGCYYSLSKAPAKWEYSEQLKQLLKEVKESQKEEEADGRATNLNEGKKVLKFNTPKDV